jgi:serine/threonine protein kinase
MQVWQLGYYELVRPLGDGGMAQVYLGRDVRLDRDVAVKVLDEHLAQRPGFRERFLREARVAAALDHPNIVSIFDFGETGSHLYLVMPFISGGSLQDELRRAPMPPAVVAAYGTQMADALAYAHERGVVHRDVKPANMLLHADGRLMLSDFGLAKILDGSPPRRPGRPDAGTPEYMAPEQINGRTDERSDIYGLGVVLYLLLTGQLPFGGDTSNVVMEGHLYRLPEPPRHLNPRVTAAMQQVVLRALAKHPEERYQRASELGAALMGALVAGDVEPPPFAVTPLPPTSLPPAMTPLPPLRSPLPASAQSAARSRSTGSPWEPPQLGVSAAQTPYPPAATSFVGAPAAFSSAQARSYGPAVGSAASDFPTEVIEQPSGVLRRPSMPTSLPTAHFSQPNPGAPIPPMLPPLPLPVESLRAAPGLRPLEVTGEGRRGSSLWTWVIIGLTLVLAGLIVLFLLLLQGHGATTTTGLLG